MMQAVTIESSSSLSLRGILHVPGTQSRTTPASAILLPGLVGNRVGPHRILLDVAYRLADTGLPVLRCDPTGCGYSDGDYTSISFESLVQDVRDMMDFLQRELGVEQFLLGGICRGSKIALAVSLIDSRVSHLMLLSCPRLHDDALKRKATRRRWSHLQGYLRRLSSFQWLPRLLSGDLNLRLITKAIVNPINRDSLRHGNIPDEKYAFGKHDANSIFVYGEKDPDIVDCLRYYHEKLDSRPGKTVFRTIPGADHGFYASHWHKAVLETLQQWWNSQT